MRVYRSDFSQWAVPDDVPLVRMTKEGRPDLRFKDGRLVSSYVQDQLRRERKIFSEGNGRFVPQTYRRWLQEAANLKT